VRAELGRQRAFDALTFELALQIVRHSLCSDARQTAKPDSVVVSRREREPAAFGLSELGV
jgi:hypothetical protein